MLWTGVAALARVAHLVWRRDDVCRRGHRHGRGPAAQGPRRPFRHRLRLLRVRRDLIALSSRSEPAGRWRTCWSRAGTCASMRSTAYFGPRRARCSISSRCSCSASSSPRCSSGPGTWPPPATSSEIRSNSPQRLPLAWAQLPWFAGIALFFLALVLAFLRSLVALLRGDYAAAAAIAGAASQDEEIESELEGLGIHTRAGAGAGDRR